MECKFVVTLVWDKLFLLLPSNAQRNSAPIGSVVQLPFIEHAHEYHQLKHDEIFILSMKKKMVSLYKC